MMLFSPMNSIFLYFSYCSFTEQYLSLTKNPLYVGFSPLFRNDALTTGSMDVYPARSLYSDEALFDFIDSKVWHMMHLIVGLYF